VITRAARRPLSVSCVAVTLTLAAPLPGVSIAAHAGPADANARM
jgi:hypothetical protein